MLSIPATKGFEIGSGFAGTLLTGSEHNDEFYTDETNEEFKTLHQWNKDGFKVNKGAVSFLVWGKPKPMKKEQETAPKQATDEEEDEFFPLCYLFSNAQVTKR